MKVIKTFSLDTDVIEELKKDKSLNVSELINNMLKDYLNKKHFLGLSKEELEIELKVAEMEKEHKARVEALRNG